METNKLKVLDNLLAQIDKEPQAEYIQASKACFVALRFQLASGPPSYLLALSYLLAGWLMYADAYESGYDCPVGGDGVLSAPWDRIGASILGLLDNDTGEFDPTHIRELVKLARQQEGLEHD